MQEVIERALELFPERNEKRDIRIKFSRAFKGYNANCTYSPYKIEFRLSYKWKDVSSEILIGLLQELLCRVYKKKRQSYNIELYNKFIKKSVVYAPPSNIDIELKECFDRVNEEYFQGLLDCPNLEWGQDSLTKLGSYDFMTNTISISTILKNEGSLLDYVMYHEMLHKKIQYNEKKYRKTYHTKEFRLKEKAFKDKDIEKKLESFLKKKRIKKLFSFR
jgi:hypothetical protein